jgi:hypothetical protein
MHGDRLCYRVLPHTIVDLEQASLYGCVLLEEKKCMLLHTVYCLERRVTSSGGRLAIVRPVSTESFIFFFKTTINETRIKHTGKFYSIVSYTFNFMTHKKLVTELREFHPHKT